MNDTIRSHFPILAQSRSGIPLIYLDNAATMQVPYEVTHAATHRIETLNANVHRGIYRLSEESTAEYETSRAVVAKYLNASPDEIVFTQGTTHSINMVASSLEHMLMPGESVVATIMEHHSNLIPWQQICAQKGATLRLVPLTSTGDLDLDCLENYLQQKPRLLAFSQCSNVLGTVSDVKKITAMAHKYGVPVLVDGAQGIAHSHPDMQKLDCDFYCFSAHKIMGLTGTGILYARKEQMSKLLPSQFGGGMVKECRDYSAEFQAAPYSLEAGTPNFIGATALTEALRLREKWNEQKLFQEEEKLLKQTEEGLESFPRVQILGHPKVRRGVISFVVKGAHPFDITALLDQKGIAVRSGHHCAMPLLTALGHSYSIRVSPSFYNTEQEISYFLDALEEILRIL